MKEQTSLALLMNANLYLAKTRQDNVVDDVGEAFIGMAKNGEYLHWK
jgi:hypothetical protein